jgi:hypothetical protein
VARLVKALEQALDTPRDRWPPQALRALWEPLRETAEARAHSPQHEARWLSLAGYCLRPGAGYPLDENRVKALWPVFHQGLNHARDPQCWAEWWILWRRVAAGLNRTHHDEVHRRLAPFLTGKAAGGGKKPARPRPEPHELAEMWRCAGSLERLPASVKQELGMVLAEHVKNRAAPPPALWCFGRLGARVPLYGPANTVVAPEVASGWAELLLAWEPRGEREAGDLRFALGQLARISGDRARDLDEAPRSRVLARLIDLGATDEQLLPVREYHELAVAQQSTALGDALPAGLRLVSDPTPATAPPTPAEARAIAPGDPS